ncbi:hypothetical protein [Chromobacterium sp. IIBBL 290-4]|uniref:hypothetical protein n=1 Tax=Chromobacterium sp. IIBBL 290-4 TaxID=2953890 RepID=UPI0020B87A0B|nr:hypothetical protein [Chromobacterium sp. IIBBL 290-4]UTH72508.1 hypothetical protein NKT35_13205 [Chromobacterium sp. IIBBL 290-4]
MAAYLENSLAFLADNHQAFKNRTADSALCTLGASHLAVLQGDVAVSLTVLGELVINYGEVNSGVENAVLQHMGHTLRLLGEVACFTEREYGEIATTVELQAAERESQA